MASRSALRLSLLPFLSLAAAQKVVFDGRVPAGTDLAVFDAKNNFFGADSVFGENLTFSKLLVFPDVTPSLFDNAGTVPLEVTVSDESIFAPSADNKQLGFRRAELNPAAANGSDDSVVGVKTLHFSIQKDSARPFNLSHEYQMVFLESNDFSTNQVVLKTGTILDQATADPDTLMLFGNVKEANLLFSTPFTADTFHNFAVTLDFDKNTTQVFYSTGNDPLAQMTEAVPNDVSGGGLYHFGMLKKPTDNAPDADITKEGFQEAGINEGIIYGSIFLEDSADGTVTLSPAGAATGATGGNASAAVGGDCASRRAIQRRRRSMQLRRLDDKQ